MKFTSDRSSLLQALQQVGKVTPTRSTLPILGSVLLSGDGDRLSLRATDLEITQVVSIPAKISQEGSVAIQHRTLMEITGEMPEGEIEIQVADDRKVQISTSFGSYSIMGKPVDEFPSLPAIDGQQAVKLPAALLKRVIDKTAFAVSRDELKPSLMGVLLQFQDDGLLAVATDGHRLVKHRRTDYTGNGYQGSTIVPVKFLNILSGYLDGDDDITLNIGENHLAVESHDMQLFTRIIDERFPDYEGVFPDDNDKTLKIDRNELLAAVRRVSIFSNKTTHQIALKLSADGLELSTEDVETVSSAHETLPGDFTGDPLTVGYNSNYLRDLVTHMDGNQILMQFRTPVSAAVIRPEEQQEGESLVMLLMPIRLSD
ncbi:MAG: DNA polymerase III subunit beta [Candidatus Marinimicrobia bacterium]|nr:DNA polymerase III subunit beta [Candidatus Neomarinimicrobiota bacterium]